MCNCVKRHALTKLLQDTRKHKAYLSEQIEEIQRGRLSAAIEFMLSQVSVNSDNSHIFAQHLADINLPKVHDIQFYEDRIVHADKLISELKDCIINLGEG